MIAAVVILLAAIAACFLGLSSGSARRRRHRRRREAAKRVRETLGKGGFKPAQALSYLRKVNPYTFEELVLDGFERDGYIVCRNDSYSGDGGKDGMVLKGGRTYLVQSKRYCRHIDRTHVEDFSRLCSRECKEGFFVHTGRTGKGSRRIAQDAGNVTIVGGDRMLRLVGYVGSENC